MTSMHSKVASAEKDGDQYHLVADLVLVPSEFRAIRRFQIQRGKEEAKTEKGPRYRGARSEHGLTIIERSVLLNRNFTR
jgi:hypothetical protein